MKPAIGLSDEERFPLLKDLSFLNALRQDPCAPRYNFSSGDCLTEAHLQKVRAYEKEIRFNRVFRNQGEWPQWLPGFLDFCIDTVPFYAARSRSFAEQPTTRRSDIQSQPWAFVSNTCPLDDLLVYQTSGTTGPAMDVVFDPVAQACWLPQLESVLDRYGITLTRTADRVAVALICAQSSTLTYASLSTYLDGAGVLKINLDPSNWTDPSHRVQYLEKWDPEVLTGDPFAFAALMELGPALHPKVMVSSAMRLSEGLRQKLEAYFGCPVLDIYSLTECRNIAVAEEGRHRAIRPDLYLEVFDKEKDVVLPVGERGELVVTGGNNPFLPLVRYRTGDYCSLQIEDGVPYLVGLEAREAVAFYTAEGIMVNNIEISRGLADLPLAGFCLHQDRDYHLRFKGWSSENIEEMIRQTLLDIFHQEVDLEVCIESLAASPSSKPVTYTTDVSKSEVSGSY